MGSLEFLSALRKRWLYLLLPILFGLAGGIAITEVTDPQYQATTSLYFSLPFGGSANDLIAGSNYTQKQLISYATLATKPVVLDKVIVDLGLTTTARSLAGSINAVTSNDTVIIELTATSATAQGAADLANAVATELKTTVKALAPKRRTDRWRSMPPSWRKRSRRARRRAPIRAAI